VRRWTVGSPLSVDLDRAKVYEGHGFAVGAGFALVENIHYLVCVPEAGLPVWMIRGFGTATIHGCAGALCAIVSTLSSETRSGGAGVFLPGLLGAIAAHSLHNHFIEPPLLSTAGITLVFPGLVFLVFRSSERSLQHWLGTVVLGSPAREAGDFLENPVPYRCGFPAGSGPDGLQQSPLAEHLARDPGRFGHAVGKRPPGRRRSGA